MDELDKLSERIKLEIRITQKNLVCELEMLNSFQGGRYQGYIESLKME